MTIDDSFYEAAKALLQSLGAPLTPENVNIIAAWSYCEKPHYSGAAWQWNNPLNTTLACCEWTGNANESKVKIYPSKEAGIEATKETILNGLYPTLVQALTSSNPKLFLSARGEIQTWGTNPDCIASDYYSLGSPPNWAVSPTPQPTPQPTLPPPAEIITIVPLGILGIATAGLFGLGGAGTIVLAKKEEFLAPNEYKWMLVVGGVLITTAGIGYVVWRRSIPATPEPPWKVSSTVYNNSYADLAIAWGTSPKAEYYEVQQQVDNLIIYKGTYTYTTIYGLTAGSPYTVRVRACNWAGCSPWSNWVTLYT